MKVLVVLLTLFAAPAAFADTYYTCGCTPLEKGAPGFLNKKNWVLQSAWDRAYAEQRRDEACRARFGRGTPLNGGCITNILKGKELADYKRRLNKRIANAREAEARERREYARSSRERDEAIRRGSRALDEVIRRNREDEIDRVLKEARECRMYGNCPGR